MAFGDFKVAGTISGNAPRFEYLAVKAASSFKAGEPVALTNGDTVKLAVAAEVYGIAGENATYQAGEAAPSLVGTVKAKILVYPLNQDTLFTGNFKTGTTPTAKNIGQIYDIDMTGPYTVDIATSTNLIVLLQDLDTSYSPVKVIFSGNRGLTAATGSQALGCTTRNA